MKQINFQTENLVVDYISLNIRGFLKISDIQLIVNYFSQNLGFNSYFGKRIHQKWKLKSLIWNETNTFYFSFRQYDYDPSIESFWVGTKIIFSGKNAREFYHFLQTNDFDWNIFPLAKTSLSRFDIHYLRELPITDQDHSLEQFMQQSCQKVKAKSERRKAEWNKKNGFILKIGNRKSEKYLRVYQKGQGLEFELELKTKYFQHLLFENNLNELEDKLSKDYYYFLFRSLTLNTCYTDWLTDRLRKIIKPEFMNISMTTDYLIQDSLDTSQEREYLFRLFQFLAFIHQYQSFKESIANGDQTYYFVTFPVFDFLKFISSEDVNSSKAKRQYQLQKVIQFLESLKKIEPVTENFSDLCFRSYVIFPYARVIKPGKSWIGQVSIAEQLYNYKYPFYLPKEFLYYNNRYEMEVKLEIIQSFSTIGLEKTFAIEAFLDRYTIPNQKRAEIKRLIIDLFEQLKTDQIIEPIFTIVPKKGSPKKVKKLTSLLLTKSKEFYFYEILNFK